jgi:hypothetical protein
MGAWLQLTAGMFKVPQLNRVPWGAADVVSAKAMAFGGFATVTERVRFEWRPTNETGNGIYHPGRDEWHCAFIDDPVVDTSMVGSIALAKVYDAGDTLRPIPILTHGVGAELSGTPVEVDLTDWVKALLGQRANGTRGFQVFPQFANGSALEPGEEATPEALRRIRDACIDWNLDYSEDAATVEVPGYGSMDVVRWGTGSVTFKRVEFSLGLAPIVVEFAGGFELAANARVAYEVPPAAD